MHVVFGVKARQKRSLGRPRRKILDRIDVAQDRDQWSVLMSTAMTMTTRVP
jgi:hypothetical protein